MIKHILPLETRPKKNSRITLKNGRTIPSKIFKEWHEVAYMMLKNSVTECIGTPVVDEKGKVIKSEHCYIILIFTHGDYIKRDADNGVSSIFDLLKKDVKKTIFPGIGQIYDDNWQVIKTHYVYNDYSKNQPSCEIRIYKEEELEQFISDSTVFARRYS